MNANEIQDLIVRGRVHYHSAIRTVHDDKLTSLFCEFACRRICQRDFPLHQESKSAFSGAEWFDIASWDVGAGDGVDSICADNHVSGDFRAIL